MKRLICLCCLFVGLSIDAPGKIVYQPYLQNVKQDGVTIMWLGDKDTTGYVEFGPDSNFCMIDSIQPFQLASEKRWIFERPLTNLQAGIQYYYHVICDNDTSQIYSFRTIAPGNAFRCVIYGDSRKRYDHFPVAVSILQNKPDVIFHTGDFAARGSDLEHWEHHFFEQAVYLPTIPLFPVIGNHDVVNDDVAYYRSFFSVPENGQGERYYYVDYMNVRFIIVDSYTNFYPDSEQYQWLEQTLSSATQDWVIVLFHQPPFASCESGKIDVVARGILVPLFNRYEVDLVFNGHAHNYERSEVDGIHYIVTGGGGAELKPINETENPYQIYADEIYHHCLLEINGPWLRFKAIDKRQNVFDSFFINKPRLTIQPPALIGNLSTTNLPFKITNSGGGLLAWQAEENPDQTWLTAIMPDSGTLTPAETTQVNIRLNPKGLAFGIHRANISVSSNGGNQNIPIKIQESPFHVQFLDLTVVSTESTAIIPLTVAEDLTHFGITSYQAEVKWNPTMLTNPVVQHEGTLTELWSDQGFSQEMMAPGHFSFEQHVNTPALADSGILLKIKVKIMGQPGDSTRLALQSFRFNQIEAIPGNGWLKINQPPQVDQIKLIPQKPKESEKLTAHYQYIDFDGDQAGATQVKWYRNDLLQSQFNNQLVIPPATTTRGERWKFTVRPHDGIEFGAPGRSPEVRIANTPPYVDSLGIFPPDPMVGERLHANYVLHDDEGDAEAGSQIRWYNNGMFQPIFNDSLTIPPATTQLHEKWHFTIKPKDGEDFGTLQKSPLVEIRPATTIADFFVRPIVGQPGVTIRYFNQSRGQIAHSFWELGDGTEIKTGASQTQFQHEYLSAGSYFVALKVAGASGVDSLFYPDLIYVDEQALDLKLVQAGKATPGHEWQQAIDQNVFTDEGSVLGSLAEAWAIFMLPDTCEGEISKFRLKRSAYRTTIAADKFIKSYEISVSTTGTGVSDFKKILFEKFSSDDWHTILLETPVRARYLKLRLLKVQDTRQDSFVFSEFQAFGKVGQITEVQLNSEPSATKPLSFYLSANFPNPFNPHTKLQIDLPETAEITLSIYNLHGQLIRRLVTQKLGAGSYLIEWDGLDKTGEAAASGTYFCHLRAILPNKSPFHAIRKMVLLR